MTAFFPDSDPAGDIADVVESGDVEIELSEDQDEEELREFIQHIEESDEPVDSGANAAVRIARAILEQSEN